MYGYGSQDQDDDSRVSAWVNPREHKTRQMLENRIVDN